MKFFKSRFGQKVLTDVSRKIVKNLSLIVLHCTFTISILTKVAQQCQVYVYEVYVKGGWLNLLVNS